MELPHAAVQVWRNGDFSQRFKHRGKGHAVAIPLKGYLKCVAAALATVGINGDCLAVDNNLLRQRATFPTLAVAHQTEPSALTCSLKYELIVVWGNRLQAKNLDLTACRFAKTKPGIYHASVVVNEHGIARQQFGHFIEQVLLNVLVPVHQHLALFTLGKGMLCYALFGKRVVIVGDAQVAHII